MLGAESIFKFIENDDSLIQKYETLLQDKKSLEKTKNKSTPDRIVVGDLVIFVKDQTPVIGTSKFIRV